MEDLAASRKSELRGKEVKTPDPVETPLFRLMRMGLLFKAEVELRRLGRMPNGLSVNASEEQFGWGLLHFACHKGAAGLVDWLLKQKARTDLVDSEGNTPLVLCAKSNHVEAMELLMARGASITQRTKEANFTPLLWAAAGGHIQAAKSLLEADAEVEDRDLEDRTPLMWAARHGHLSVVKLLLRRCPDLTHRDKEGLAALDHCREHLEMRAAVVLAQEQCQRLADGAQRNDLPLVEHLLQHGALPRYKDAGGWTPLTWAVLHNSADMAHVLVRYGAYPELIGENSELGQQLSRRGRQVGARLASVLGANTRLLDAAQASNFTDAQEALEQGACPNAKQGHDGGGGGLAPRSKGRISVADRQDEILAGAEEAVRCGAEPMGEGAGRNMTATMWAARHGNADLVRLLGLHKADMNLRDARGWTAVLWGSLTGDAETIAVLHHFKAELHQKSWEGDSAVHLSVRCDHHIALQLLLAAKADVEEKSIEGHTPLHCAALFGSTKAMVVLLHYGGNPSTQDKLGRLPMFIAACGTSPKACEVLCAGALEALPQLPVELPEPEEERPGSSKDGKAKAKAQNGKWMTSSAPLASVAPPSRSNQRPKTLLNPLGAAEGSEGPSAVSSRRSSHDNASARSGSRRSSEAQRTGSRRKSREVTSRDSRRPSQSKVMGSKDEASVTLSDGFSKEIPTSKDEAWTLIGQELLLLAAQRRLRKMSKPTKGPGVQRLLDANSKGETPLHVAVDAGQSLGHFKVLSKLVDLQANCNARDRHGETPLMRAAAANYSEAVEKMLREPSTQVDLKDNRGRTAAHLAADHPSLRATLERAMVQARTGMGKSKGASFTAKPAQTFQPDDAVFRVRMEKLPTKMTPEDLERKITLLLKKVVVKPVHMEVVMDPILGRPRGHCFIDFLDSRSSEKALELDGSDLAGQKICVVRDVALAMVR
ncbi:unnamed protein product [Durusdinium trenchii]|uniref:RRM domain-containing protein n=2 Tax=Durusdinium trenchii TaxID=1381693 RepID=A0ABP0SNY5_9DINO